MRLMAENLENGWKAVRGRAAKAGVSKAPSSMSDRKITRARTTTRPPTERRLEKMMKVVKKNKKRNEKKMAREINYNCV